MKLRDFKKDKIDKSTNLHLDLKGNRTPKSIKLEMKEKLLLIYHGHA